ncbi:ParB N-terminal domain-containing protein [uncultured Sulfitobacter sp.]|uniref:ParB N-terminal domain-containing protein n=1 Tax=uncultured Sulfitobacter sp. TaxID=191468 RepID=UPI00262A0452|nr:ParB N-terminal domain-containing protein [uncultured Sulfitobacter sp.]
MARKRKLDATTIPLEEDTGETGKPGMGGMWGGTAMNMLRQRLDDTRATFADGILNGTVAIELQPDQVDDPTGSDRQEGWRDEPEFQALIDNIARRGQTQAIRVRPVDPAWQPDRDNPLETGDRFIIQSGRRRLAACQILNRKVIAVIATVEGEAALADLEERFHENTMRKNLSGFEELLSIGLIADALGDLSQQEIAQRLSVSQNDVSLGRACVELHDKIVAEVDIINTPKRAFREIIPRLRGGVPDKPKPTAPSKPSKASNGAVQVSVKAAANGALSLTLKGASVDPDWLAQAVADLVSKQTTH